MSKMPFRQSAVGGRLEEIQIRKRTNMDVTRLARNTLLDDFVRQSRMLKLDRRLPGTEIFPIF
jgi:hypothetical protein